MLNSQCNYWIQHGLLPLLVLSLCSLHTKLRRYSLNCCPVLQENYSGFMLQSLPNQIKKNSKTKEKKLIEVLMSFKLLLVFPSYVFK